MKKKIKRLGELLHRKVTGVHPPQGFLSATAILGAIISLGTLFYHLNQGWSYLDALYFSVMTVTTVGYGDLHPTNDVSKVFTMFLVLFGAGLGVYIISTFAASLIEGRKNRVGRIAEILRKVAD